MVLRESAALKHFTKLVGLKILQKKICRSVGPLLAISLEPLAHRRIETSLSLFYRKEATGGVL